MATVPGPRPDKPLPIPGAPGKQRPGRKDEERHTRPTRGDEPAWKPQPYRPGKEREEEREPVGVPS